MKEVRYEPPQWMLRFFKWFCRPELHKYLEGDLLELFDLNIEQKGLRKARWKFTLEVIKLFRKDIIKPVDGTQKLNNYGMVKNHLKVSVRSMLRKKTFTLLNVLGLGIGIASCLMILIFVQNELSYDTYNSKYDQTYRVLQRFGGEIATSPEDQLPVSEYQVWGNAPVAGAMMDFFPEVEHVFRFTSDFDWLVEYNGNRFQEKGICFADSTLYQVFEWDWIAGDPKTALTRPGTIILSAAMAEKYFGNENPIGEQMTMDGDEKYEVTAVYEIPPNSHFDYPAFMSMTSFINMRPQIFENWGYVDFYTYFTLRENTSIASMETRIPEFLKQRYDEISWYHLRFEALADAYLNSDAKRQPGPVGNSSNIYLFISVAIFILVIACINFMNLSTARSMERAKEVAIRKTIGSRKSALVVQFLMEATLMTSIAASLALVLVIVGFPYLELLVGKSLTVSGLLQPVNYVLFVVGVLILGLLTGSYPAFVISNFKAVTVLKGSFKSSKNGVWLRKGLVVLQFSLSVILLVGTTVVANQLNYLRSYDKGYDSEQVLVIDYGWDNKVQRNLKVIKSALAEHPSVQAISASRATPGDFFPGAGTSIASKNGEMLGFSPALYEIDEDFIPTYQMEMVAGRNFDRRFPADSATSLIVNEAAAKLYGYEDPKEIVGKKFSQWGREGQVIGVVKNFNYLSLHQEVEPMTLRYSTKWTTSMLSMRLNSQDFQETLAELEGIWNGLAPHYPFVSRFNDQNFNRQYETDARFGNVFSIFSGLAIFVACLGLFGLTIFSTAQRAKEIGVRKVLGASVQKIVALLSYDFIKLYLLSLVMAIPASYWVMDQWLDGFAYRISMGWGVFVVAALVTFFVSMITMSLKTIGAALANPTKSLRDE
ncbi:MAG: ABC transporter permease [Cytophagales bacterium]|nr:ABC transporter permease [Cytophagales bacterium]